MYMTTARPLASSQLHAIGNAAEFRRETGVQYCQRAGGQSETIILRSVIRRRYERETKTLVPYTMLMTTPIAATTIIVSGSSLYVPRRTRSTAM